MLLPVTTFQHEFLIGEKVHGLKMLQKKKVQF